MKPKTSLEDYRDCLTKTSAGLGFELSSEIIELGYEGLKEFHISVIRKACWWYIWQKQDKYKSNFLMDIRKRCVECNEFPSQYTKDGITYGLVNVIDGEPKYLTATELTQRQIATDKQKRIPESERPPIEQPVKRLTFSGLMNKMAKFIQGTEPPPEQKANQAEQTARLKERYE